MGHPTDGTRAIALFGGAAIQVDGVPLGGRAAHRHPLAILALLVGNAGRPITRDKLIALLWPERDTDSARNLLKVNIHELRKELGDGSIRSTGDQLSIDATEISCDVTSFLAAVSEGDDARAAQLYVGPFLDGFFLKDAVEFEHWVDTERQRLAELHGEVLDRLAQRAEAASDYDAAIRWRRTQAAQDPYHPEVTQRLMEALAASGDRAGAIKVAETFAQRRREDLGITDDDGLVTLARSLATTYTPATSTRTLEPPDRAEHQMTAATHEPNATAIRRPPRSQVGFAIGAAVAIGVMLFAALMLRQRDSSAAGGGVSVRRFNVVGADSAMGAEEASLLSARLADSPLLGAKTGVVTGEIVGSYDSLVVSASLSGAREAAPIATARAAGASGASLAGLTDRLAIELLARVIGEPADRIAGIASRPFAAARRYLLAQSAYKSGRYASAESSYAQALTADSTFGAAGLGLAMANSWTVINEHYGIGRDAAMAHLSTMSDRDRDFALAFFGPDPALGKPQPAPVYLKRWEDLVEKYPDWTEAWYQLGDRYYHFGGLSGLADADERARHAFRRAVEQDSQFVAPLHHLVELYAARRELPDLRTTGDRYFAANPTVRRDASSIGWEMATALGDGSWLGRIAANFDSMPREELARIGWVTDENGWPHADAKRAATIADRKAGIAAEHERTAILLFAMAQNAGDAKASRAATEALQAQFPDRPVGALWDLFGAMFGIRDSVLAAQAAGRLADFARSPLSSEHVRRDQQQLAACMVGYWSATRGDVATGRASLDRVKGGLRGETNNFVKRNASVCSAMLEATLETTSHGPAAKRAVAQLDTMLLEQRVPPHIILEAGTLVSALLHAEQGDTAAALLAARRREHLTGDPILLASELEAEARYATATGDKEGAARAAAHLAALKR